MKQAPNRIFFNEVVELYYQPLYRFAFSLSKHEDQASDLTQETFRTFARHGGELRDKSKAKSWLFTTLYREFLRNYNRSKRIDHYEPAVLETHLGGSVQSDVRRKYDANLALQALESVDELFREPLSLFYLEDLSYKEIAEVLELPIGTVMSRLSRGKAQLREVFLNASNTEGLVPSTPAHTQK
jgi:RNA polymerase sigma factor (sigma-70 family)